MAYTYTSGLAAKAAPDLDPWMTDHLAWWLDAVGSMFDPTYSIVSEQGNDGDPGYVPGFGALFDVDLCPPGALGYLGQFVGVQIPKGASDAKARSLVREEAGFQRGTLGAVQAAANRYLLPGQTAIVVERVNPQGQPDAYQFAVVFVGPVAGSLTFAQTQGTFAQDTRGWLFPLDLAGLIADVNAAKPAGVLWTFQQSPGWTFGTATNTFAVDGQPFAYYFVTQP